MPSASGEPFDELRPRARRAGRGAGQRRHRVPEEDQPVRRRPASDGKDLPASTREQLLAQQVIVLGLIEGKQSTGDLDASQKSEMFAALDAIATMVNKASDERMVCQMRKTLGSNRNERVCRTAGQIREERETVRHRLDRTGMQGIQGN